MDSAYARTYQGNGATAPYRKIFAGMQPLIPVGPGNAFGLFPKESVGIYLQTGE